MIGHSTDSSENTPITMVDNETDKQLLLQMKMPKDMALQVQEAIIELQKIIELN